MEKRNKRMEAFTKGNLIGMVVVFVLVSIASAGFAGDAYEPDNTRSAYRNIAVGQYQYHTISPVGDVDWMRFVPPSASSKYTIRIYAQDFDLVLEPWVKLGMLPEIPRVRQVIKKGSLYVGTLSPTNSYWKIGVYPYDRSQTGFWQIRISYP